MVINAIVPNPSLASAGHLKRLKLSLCCQTSGRVFESRRSRIQVHLPRPRASARHICRACTTSGCSITRRSSQFRKTQTMRLHHTREQQTLHAPCTTSTCLRVRRTAYPSHKRFRRLSQSQAQVPQQPATYRQCHEIAAQRCVAVCARQDMHQRRKHLRLVILRAATPICV